MRIARRINAPLCVDHRSKKWVRVLLLEAFWFSQWCSIRFSSKSMSQKIAQRTHKYDVDKMAHHSRAIKLIINEFTEGFKLMSTIGGPAVTVFGGTHTALGDHYYLDAELLGRELAKAGFAVVTGGGPGIMEAANKGAYRAGGVSVGVNIRVLQQRPNQFQTISLSFDHFYVRKVMLAKYSTGFVVFPGGFGTLDEFAEILTLVQSQKLHPLPIYIVGSQYWSGLLEWFKDTLVKGGAIPGDDLKLFKVVDDIMSIPRDIAQYYNFTHHAGFKVPKERDRRLAAGTRR